VNYREVGDTGVRVSEIGFGCGGNAGLMVKGTPEQQREAILRALELGINYFDEAPDYGDGISETNLGRAFKDLGARPYITTKIEVRADDLGDIAGNIVRSVDQSLKRLGVDYVDFLQVHNGPVLEPPVQTGRSYTHLTVDDYLRTGGALEGLLRAQRDGKTRLIGFITRGNDYPAVQRLIETGAFNLINVSVNLLNPSAATKPYGMEVERDYGGILGYAAAHGIGVSVYSPLAGGFLNDNAVAGGGPHPVAGGRRAADALEAGLRQAKAVSFLSRNLNPDSQTEDHHLAEAAMRFVLSLEGVTTVLGGFSDRGQVEEMAACSGRGPLSEQNMARLEMVWRSNFGVTG
jgi:L-glyceraldehyde 3-phosphate reductase